MHSSIVLASLFGALAIAAPAHQQLHKKAYVYDIVTETVTVTVTAGEEPEIRTIAKTVYAKPTVTEVQTTKSESSSSTTTTTISTTTTVPTTSSTTTTPPPPTTTTQPPPPPPSTTQPPPPPPTTTEPAPIPTTTVAPPAVFAAVAAPEPVKPEPVVAPVVEAPAPVQAPSSSSGNGVKDAALNSHNAYRTKHHAEPLSWDDSLASSAAALASGCTNKHGMIVGGQNIAAKGVSGSGNEVDFMTGAVDAWYDEVNQFGGYYGSADVSDMSVLHFTQVVWKGTTKVGCAVANCGTKSSFFPGYNAYTIVCNYKAAGNFGGQYAANVAAP